MSIQCSRCINGCNDAEWHWLKTGPSQTGQLPGRIKSELCDLSGLRIDLISRLLSLSRLYSGILHSRSLALSLSVSLCLSLALSPFLHTLSLSPPLSLSLSVLSPFSLRSLSLSLSLCLSLSLSLSLSSLSLSLSFSLYLSLSLSLPCRVVKREGAVPSMSLLSHLSRKLGSFSDFLDALPNPGKDPAASAKGATGQHECGALLDEYCATPVVPSALRILHA